MIQNPYKQIGSSFVLGNVDRFGQPYYQLKQHIEVPGPGAYQIPQSFMHKRNLLNKKGFLGPRIILEAQSTL